MQDEKPTGAQRESVNPAMRQDPPRPHEADEKDADAKAEPGVRGTQGVPLNPLDAGGIAE